MSRSSSSPILDDLLTHDLRLVFCGTAPSKKSAAEKAYYAHACNRFWPTLAETGITPTRLYARDYKMLLSLGIGFTDLCKTESGNDDELSAKAFDVARLRANILCYQPGILAFTSRTAASVFLGVKHVELGLQSQTVGKTKLFALTSTSGGNGHWKTQRHSWDALAQLLQKDYPLRG